MAEQRQFETPDSDDIEKPGHGFRGETSVGIADPHAERARPDTDVARLKEEQDKGLLISEIHVDGIDETAMIRDRTIIGEGEMMELRQSISSHGLRLPIEIFELEQPNSDGQRYGLLSGYRRLMAVRALYDLTEDDKYRQIKAIIRPRCDEDAAFISMVEENEVREELSHYERGRIAVIAANQGAFANTEEAVNRLYGTGSKAKRSKIRSFALVFEELGDILDFPEALTEKRGLRLASALRCGEEVRLRDALSGTRPSSGEEEWFIMEPVLRAIEEGPQNHSRGGRPRSKPLHYGWIDSQTIRTSSGITIRKAKDSKGHILRFEGAAIDGEIMESLIAEIVALLEK